MLHIALLQHRSRTVTLYLPTATFTMNAPLLCLSLLATFLTIDCSKCPQQEFVFPCTCRPGDTGIFVVCHQVNNTNRLRTIFQLLREYEISRLSLKDCHLVDSGNPGIFHGMNIKLLRLMDTTLVRMNPNRPGPLNALAATLERLDLTSCEGSLSLGQLSLQPLATLDSLNVVRDRLAILRKEWLPKPAAIRTLRLDECGIANIESKAFAHISTLKTITLSKNLLTIIERDVFPDDCTELLSIDLSENRLRSLPAGFFDGMTNLHTINIYGNHFATLDQPTWDPVWSRLEKLWINGNNIVCDESVEWIVEKEKPKSLYGACAIPERLRGVQLNLLSKEALHDN